MLILQVAKESEKRLREAEKQAEKEFAAMKKDVERSQKRLDEAFESMPKGWDLVGMQVVESLVDGVGQALAAVPSMVSPMGKASAAAGALAGLASGFAPQKEASGGAAGQQTSAAAAKQVSKDCKIAKLLQQQLFPLISVFGTFIDKDGKRGINSTAITDEEAGGDVLVGKLEHTLKQMTGKNTGESGIAGSAAELCKEGVNVVTELQKSVKSLGDIDKKKKTELISKVESVVNEMNSMNTKVRASLGAPPMVSPGPHQVNTQKEQGGKMSGAQAAVQGAHLKIEQSRGMLEVAQARYDKSNDELKEANQALTEELKNLASLDLEELNLTQIKATLKKGIKTLADLKEQWEKLVRLFSMISNLVKVSMHSQIQVFKDSVADSRELKLGGMSMSEVQRDLIYAQAMEANKFAYVVNVISTSYKQISDEHIMPPVACLSQLLALDSEKDRAEIQKMQKKLTDDCTKAQNAIKALNDKERENFHGIIEKRLGQIENELAANLPEISPKKKKAIKESVSSAVQDMKQAEEGVKYTTGLDDICDDV